MDFHLVKESLDSLKDTFNQDKHYDLQNHIYK